MDDNDKVKFAINYVNLYLQSINANPNKVKVLENVGEFSYIIKFPQFNDFGVTITLQVPSK